MKNSTTVIAPILETLMEKYTAPGWLIFFGGTLITLAFILALVCYKCSKCTFWSYKTCGNCCNCCNKCLLASAQNCTDCTEGYKTCVVNTYDAATFAPRYIRAQQTQVYNISEATRMHRLRHTRAIPTRRVGFPDPFDQ